MVNYTLIIDLCYFVIQGDFVMTIQTLIYVVFFTYYKQLYNETKGHQEKNSLFILKSKSSLTKMNRTTFFLSYLHFVYCAPMVL